MNGRKRRKIIFLLNFPPVLTCTLGNASFHSPLGDYLLVLIMSILSKDASL